MKFLKILFAIPKTIYVNFRFLSVKEAFKLPIWVTWNTKIEGYGGGGNSNGLNKTFHDSHWLPQL